MAIYKKILKQNGFRQLKSCTTFHLAISSLVLQTSGGLFLASFVKDLFVVFFSKVFFQAGQLPARPPRKGRRRQKKSEEDEQKERDQMEARRRKIASSSSAGAGGFASAAAGGPVHGNRLSSWGFWMVEFMLVFVRF